MAPQQFPELLAPAGTFEKLIAAVHYGADAVYFGGPRYGLRAKAGNFPDEAIAAAVSFAHDNGVRAYVTVNIIALAEDFKGLESYLLLLENAGVDGVIISDPGILSLARSVIPHVPIHLSTQANVTNPATASFWAKQGIARLNLARELSLSEVREIRAAVDVELELFVHGALCISYSGRCMLSNYMTGRDANQGACAHPCRYRYAVVEEKRPGEYFPVEEDHRGTYIFNSKDLCLLRRLPELVAAGVDSLKIEGRMKSIFYVGGVVRAYRAALDYLHSLDPAVWEKPEDIVIPEEMSKEVARTGTRDATENFIDESPGASEMLYGSSRFDQHFEPVAVITALEDVPIVEARNVIGVGETIEYMQQSLAISRFVVEGIMEPGGTVLTRANPGTVVKLWLSGNKEVLKKYGMFRRRRIS